MSKFYGNVTFLGVARMTDKVIVASVQYNVEMDLTAVVNMLKQLQEDKMTPQAHFAFEVGDKAWSLMADQGLVFMVCTKKNYPQSIGAACLKELCRQFMSVGKDASSAKPGGLDGKCKNMLEKLCGKYDNLSEVSKMHEVLQKVETVKLTMQDNIEQALLNCTALEDVEGKAARLQEDSKVFKQNANTLKRKQWYKLIKWQILLVCLVLFLVGGLTLVICAETGAFEQDDDKGKND
eukprot:CAMPEP_0182570348 /NCGR_PEP_ID=MMETSP1324-20130603/10689_1 /TAXON_ID=236786 /ORGANISM="Florenciella sp., Strain RCC1587" /LENGTH=235 /DNA_ID=CAMNT_0024784729 /DNA_START=26 /DNA_END=733 /DNA_ORIENTATION=+